MSDTCSTCKYFCKSINSYNNKENDSCCRFPPQAFAVAIGNNVNIYNTIPCTSVNSYCGEHTPKTT